MKIIRGPISFYDLWKTKEIDLGDILKIVVDIKKRIIGADAEMHADIEEKLLEDGSQQDDLWGANLIESENTYDIEYTSFINIRPGQGNRAMEVQDPNLCRQLEIIINELIK